MIFSNVANRTIAATVEVTTKLLCPATTGTHPTVLEAPTPSPPLACQVGIVERLEILFEKKAFASLGAA